MSRPRKYRNVFVHPKIEGLQPYGFCWQKSTVPAAKGGCPRSVCGKDRPLRLLTEEFEALRLMDYCGMPQEEGARSMGVSRPTFTRIYENARRVMAVALVEGREIRICGGNYNMGEGSEPECRACRQCRRGNKQENRINIYFKTDTIMKIAVPTRGSEVDNHFGHCEYYTVFTVDGNRNIMSEQILPSPQGCGCKSGIAPVLHEMGVTLMLAGNMGEGAKNVLERNEISVVRGCSGNVRELVNRYLKGEVKDNGLLCDHHECGSHSDPEV